MAAILFIYIVAPPGGETCNYVRHDWYEDIMAYCNNQHRWLAGTAGSYDLEIGHF